MKSEYKVIGGIKRDLNIVYGILTEYKFTIGNYCNKLIYKDIIDIFGANIVKYLKCIKLVKEEVSHLEMNNH